MFTNNGQLKPAPCIHVLILSLWICYWNQCLYSLCINDKIYKQLSVVFIGVNDAIL